MCKKGNVIKKSEENKSERGIKVEDFSIKMGSTLPIRKFGQALLVLGGLILDLSQF